MTPNVRFCGNCGMPQQFQTEIPVHTEENPYLRQPKKPGKSKWPILVAALLTVCLLGAVVYLLLDKKDEQPQIQYAPPKTTQSPTETTEPIPETQAVSVAAVTDRHIRRATASSYLYEPDIKTKHTADRVLDGKMDTAWAEGVAGYGIGETITLEFDGTYMVSGFDIWAGYHKSSDLYAMNGRPQQICVIFGDGTWLSYQLHDAKRKQTITFATPVVTDSVTIQIKSSYPGTYFEDTVISEISLF